MSRVVNRVILVGNLGADPEVRSAASGALTAALRLATSESWKDKNTGQSLDRTEWHRIKLFGRQAEIAQQYFHKGQQLYVEGSLRTDRYTDKNGVERFSTSVIASVVQMLGGAHTDAARTTMVDGPPPAQGTPREDRREAAPEWDPDYDVPF